jgi:hypothetical protein
MMTNTVMQSSSENHLVTKFPAFYGSLSFNNNNNNNVFETTFRPNYSTLSKCIMYCT